MTDESPEHGRSEAESHDSMIGEFTGSQLPGSEVPPPAKSLVSDQEIAGVWVVILALLLPVLFARMPAGLTTLVRYSYWDNTAGIVYAVGDIALVWFVVWRTRVRWADVGLVRRVRYTDVLAAAAFVVFAHVLYKFAVQLLRPGGGDFDFSTSYSFRPVGGLSWALALVRTTVSAFGEELLFRGYLFTRLERVVSSKLWATLLASLAFGACHLYQGLAGALGATFFGVLATVAFAATRRLWLTTLAHTAYNLSLLVLATEPEVDPERDAQYSTAVPLGW